MYKDTLMAEFLYPKKYMAYVECNNQTSMNIYYLWKMY